MKRASVYRGLMPALLPVLLLVLSTAIAAQDRIVPKPAENTSGKFEEGNYGRTPEDMAPYRNFRKPYKMFFADEHPFLGTGRDKKPPAGLKTVKIGVLAPLDESSSEALLGRRMLNGIRLAVEEANRKGGYRGLPYELVVRDDVGPWGSSSNKMVELNDEKVWCVLGSIDGQNTHIAIRVGLKLELMTLTTGSTDPTLTETRIPWYARINTDDRQIGYALATYLFKTKNYKRVAILRSNNRYGRTGVGEFRDAARRLQRPVLVESRFAPGDRDFTPQLQKIKNYRPEAIVLWGDPPETAAALKQMRRMGIKAPVIGGDRLISPEFLKLAGPVAEGVFAVNFWNPTRKDPRLDAFRAAYRKRFGEEAEQQATHGYAGMQYTIEAIQRVGLNRVKIRDYMVGLYTWDSITGRVEFDPSWNNVGPVYIAQVRSGRFAYLMESLNGTIKPLVATHLARK